MSYVWKISDSEEQYSQPVLTLISLRGFGYNVWKTGWNGKFMYVLKT